MYSLKFKLLLGLLIISSITLMSCEDDDRDEMDMTEIIDDRIIWTGENLSFEKKDDTDPVIASNQDRITDNVWITRGNDGGQIYNINTESMVDKETSPAGTLWAEGSIENIDNLTFESFRTAVQKPQEAIGKEWVVFLVDDNIYLRLSLTKWSKQKSGGFAYNRSTP